SERPLGRGPAQLDQAPVLIDRARLAPAVRFRGHGPEQVASPQPRGLLLPRDRLGDLVLDHRLAQRRESLRIAVALAHNFGIRPILKRWARGLEQPGQGEPMRRREFQGARSAVTSAADTAVKKRRKTSRRRPNLPEALWRRPA